MRWKFPLVNAKIRIKEIQSSIRVRQQYGVFDTHVHMLCIGEYFRRTWHVESRNRNLRNSRQQILLESLEILQSNSFVCV